jgi:hypothetical protein
LISIRDQDSQDERMNRMGVRIWAGIRIRIRGMKGDGRMNRMEKPDLGGDAAGAGRNETRKGDRKAGSEGGGSGAHGPAPE